MTVRLRENPPVNVGQFDSRRALLVSLSNELTEANCYWRHFYRACTKARANMGPEPPQKWGFHTFHEKNFMTISVVLNALFKLDKCTLLGETRFQTFIKIK